MNLSALLAELKRRRVFRVAAAYVVVAFALLQAADIIFPALNLPHWTLTLVVVLAFLGFPVALVLAWAFDITPEGVVRTDARDDPATVSPAHSKPSPARLGLAALVVLVVASGGWLAWQGRAAEETTALDADLLAVLPFRVSADPSLGYLREGMLDLVAASLPAEGLRAADPRTVLSAWRRAAGRESGDLPADSALLVARRVGAGQVLLGGVVGTPAALTLSAELRDARTGRVRAQARVSGPADSLPALVDRLTREILVLGAGERDEHLSLLAEVPMPALRAYLEGRAAYRLGQYGDALTHYTAALSRDTTFALAALGFLSTRGWGSGVVPPEVDARAEKVAWETRQRLGTADRLMLAAILGPRYPDPSTSAEMVDAARQAAEAAPDRPELWHWYGDRLVHDGAAAGITDPDLLAIHAFDRAIALDSTFADPFNHRVELALMRGDSATAARLARHHLAQDSIGEVADYMRWLLALAVDDAQELEWFHVRIDGGFVSWAGVMSRIAQNSVPHMETAERAATAEERAALDMPGRAGALLQFRHPLARNRGHSSRAETAIREAVRLDPARARAARLQAIMDALFWEGDPAAAAEAARQLRPLERAPTPADSRERSAQLDARCWAEQWRLHHGDTSHTRETIARLKEERGGDASERTRASFCALLLETTLAARLGHPHVGPLLERLEAEARTGPPVPVALLRAANLTAARLFEARGEPERAFAAVRRHHQWGGNPVTFLSTFLREEGRLAALTGNRDSAIRAYQHYLTLRSDPDSALRPQVERVRAELARLEGRGGR